MKTKWFLRGERCWQAAPCRYPSRYVSMYMRRVLQICLGVFLVLWSTKALSISVELRDGQSITKDGKSFMQLDDLPRMTPDGTELGHNKIKQLVINPTEDQAAIVVSGPNHEWVGILNLKTRAVSSIKVFSESIVNEVQFSPSGHELAIAVIRKSGFKVVVCWRLNEPISSPLEMMISAKDAACEIEKPNWSKDGSSLNYRLTKNGITVGIATLFLKAKRPETEQQPVGSSKNVVVTSAPTSATTYDDTAMVSRNYISEVNTISASGTGYQASAGAGTFQFSAATYTVMENGGSLQFCISRTGGSNGIASVYWSPANGTATVGADFADMSGSVKWNDGFAGDTFFNLPIINDGVYENTEQFTLNLSNVSGASMGSPSSATVTITDDDPPETVSVPAPPSGPPSGTVGQWLTFATGGSDSSYGHSVQYQFVWGDGNTSPWGNASQSNSYGSAGTYQLRVHARCATNTSVLSSWSDASTVTIQNPETVSAPSTPFGPSSGTTGQSLTFATGGSTSSYGHVVQYQFIWGDGNASSWGSASQSYSYGSSGSYQIKAQARCSTDTLVLSSWSGSTIATIQNPEKVSVPSTPSGMSGGTTEQSLTFATGGSTSSYGHVVQYQFDWGDGNTSPWGSGLQSNNYGSTGIYQVRAHARCAADLSVTSLWSASFTLTITLPPQPILSVTPTNQPVGSGSGSTSFAVTNIGNGTMNWSATVTSGGSWARITSGLNGIDSGAVTVGYDVNTGANSRQAAVRVTAAGATGSPSDVTVTQAGYVSQGHPADTNNDWRLTINEVTSYGAAWKQGQTWQNPPNPIPIDYMTRAGYLWKNGEVYHDNGATKPEGWVTGP